MKTQHTTTPWEVTMQDEKQGQFSIGLNQDYSRLVEFTCFGKNAKANAAHIVKCVNLHDELLTELIRCRAAVKNAVESLKHLGCKSESTDYYLNEAAKSDDLLKRAKGEV